MLQNVNYSGIIPIASLYYNLIHDYVKVLNKDLKKETCFNVISGTESSSPAEKSILMLYTLTSFHYTT